MIVYCFVNQATEKYYVGITDRTIDYRWRKHVISANNGSDYHFHRAIRKYGEESFVGLVIEECSSIEELKSAERRWILFLVSNNPEYGYNMTLGGDGVFGLRMTNESRIKLRDSHLGRKHSEETKRKMSEAHKLRYTDQNNRKKTSDALMRPEVRHKMSKSRKNKTSEDLTPKIRYGTKDSETFKQRLREVNLGKVFSVETRLKMSVSAKQRWLNKKRNKV